MVAEMEDKDKNKAEEVVDMLQEHHTEVQGHHRDSQMVDKPILTVFRHV